MSLASDGTCRARAERQAVAATARKCAGRRVKRAYFFFVFFAAFGFAAAFDVVFFAFFFAVIGMRE